jgi:aconitate hydratase
MAGAGKDSFGAKGSLQVGDAAYEIYRLDAVSGDGLDVGSLPFSLKVLLENLLRTEDGETSPPPTSMRSPAGPRADAQQGIQFLRRG